jgi:alpha-mannosidase
LLNVYCFPNVLFFHVFQIKKVTEMSLSANQGRTEMEKKRLVWKVEGSSKEPKVLRGGPVDAVKLVVELAPMEIRTFVVEFIGKRTTTKG